MAHLHQKVGRGKATKRHRKTVLQDGNEMPIYFGIWFLGEFAAKVWN
jgi:hypothetical protein